MFTLWYMVFLLSCLSSSKGNSFILTTLKLDLWCVRHFLAGNFWSSIVINMSEQDQWYRTNLHYGLTKFRLLSKSYFHPLYSIICLIVPVYSSMPALDWNHSHTPWQDYSCLPWLHCCWHKPQVSSCPENSHVTTWWAFLISIVDPIICLLKQLGW